MERKNLFSAICISGVVAAAPSANAGSFFFSTGDPDGKIAVASRPESPGKFEVEAADDFTLSSKTDIKSATFTGLVPANSSVSNVAVEVYRVFPQDSDTGRTSGAPNFGTSQVPTRVNSPSDVAFATRDAASAGLVFTASVLSAGFTASSSVQPGGIHASPNQTTGGNGAVTASEVEFALTFSTALELPAGHYFFVPQVVLDNGDFLWLSAPKPIVAPGTPFNPDLQAWTRDANLDPDWLRVGTDIIGGISAPTFNMTFALDGDLATPLPATLPLFAGGLGVLGWVGWRKKKK